MLNTAIGAKVPNNRLLFVSKHEIPLFAMKLQLETVSVPGLPVKQLPFVRALCPVNVLFDKTTFATSLTWIGELSR